MIRAMLRDSRSGMSGRDDWGISDQGEVNPGVRHQVSLELSQIHVQSTIKSEGGSDGGDNLANESVQVGVGRSFDVQVSAANIINSLIVDHEGTVRVLKSGVGGQDGVVGLYHGRGNLRGWVDRELQL